MNLRRIPGPRSGYIKTADLVDVVECDTCGDTIEVGTTDHVLLTTRGTGHVCGQGFTLPPQPVTISRNGARR